MAAGSGDGGRGGGGSKIKLKIKACPESPSAPCRRQGAAGGAAAPPPQPPRPGGPAVCQSVRLSYRAPAWPPSRRPAPSTGRSAINGARGAPGAGRDQRGPKRRTLGRKQRHGDVETETERQETGCGAETGRPRDCRAERCAETETGTHRQTRGPGDTDTGLPARTVRAETQGRRRNGRRRQGPGPRGPDRTGAGDGDGRSGRQRPRDGRDRERRRGERGSRARSADPTAPRYNVSGGGGGELKASGREIKTNTEMRGASWGGGGTYSRSVY